MNQSCHTYDWVMSQTYISHVTHINESCETYQWVMSHISMSCNSFILSETWLIRSCNGWHDSFNEWVMSQSHVIHCTYEWVISQISMSHVTHINESCYTYQWVMSHIRMSHVSDKHASVQCIHAHAYTHTHILTHTTHIRFSTNLHHRTHMGWSKKFAPAKTFNFEQSVTITIEFNHHRKYESSPKFKHYDRSFHEFSWLCFPKKKKTINNKGPCIFLTLNFAPTVVKTVSKLTKPTHQIFAKLNQSQVPIHLAHAQFRAHCSKDSSNAVCCSLCKKSWPMPGVSYGITKHWHWHCNKL